MSLASLGALNSAGAGIKAVLIMFLMGPALDIIGPPRIINLCVIGSGLCNIALAMCTGSTIYSAVFMVNCESAAGSHICAASAACRTDGGAFAAVPSGLVRPSGKPREKCELARRVLCVVCRRVQLLC